MLTELTKDGVAYSLKIESESNFKVNLSNRVVLNKQLSIREFTWIRSAGQLFLGKELYKDIKVMKCIHVIIEPTRTYGRADEKLLQNSYRKSCRQAKKTGQNQSCPIILPELSDKKIGAV